jgi:hypothetical protein
MLMAVVVPAGLRAGDTMAIEAEGQVFEVMVPEGCSGGAEIEVELPVEPPGIDLNSTAEEISLEVVVPDGVGEGQAFTVETEWGSFEICVPAGCGPGSAVAVTLPEELRQVSGDTTAEPSHDEPAIVQEDNASAFRFKPGQRVQLRRSNGAYELATVSYGYEMLFDVYYECRLDDAMIKHASEVNASPLMRRQ